MPLVLYVLAVAVFAQACSEFMLAGLVGEIARDLSVSTAVAGALTSAFAVGMVIGAPLVAVLARRLPPRTALAAFLVVFVAVHVLGALTGSFPVLLGTRVVAALANAGFLAVALSAAVRMAPAGRTARATAILLAGTTLACIAGVPAGALLGQALGWRSAFWAVAALCLPALAGVLLGVPARADGAHRSSVTAELRALRRPSLVRTLLVAALVNGATFGGYTFLAPLVTDVAGLAPIWVPVCLALFGFGSFVGVGLAGRVADTRAGTVLRCGGPALAAGWAVLALVAGQPAAALSVTVVLGALAFGVGSTLIGRVLALAPDAPTLGGSYATAAFNVGAATGPLLAGLALDTTGSARAPAWVGAALVVAAAAPAGIAWLHAPGRRTPSTVSGRRGPSSRARRPRSSASTRRARTAPPRPR